MSTKTTPKPKNKAAPHETQAKTATPKIRIQSLKTVVGSEVYNTWVSMLHTLVPDGRTHRLAPLVAAMLQYALSVTDEERDDETSDNSLAQSLIDSAEASDPEEVKALLHDAVDRLFKDAKVGYRRTSARGEQYSLADEAYEEYVRWFDMPWE